MERPPTFSSFTLPNRRAKPNSLHLTGIRILFGAVAALLVVSFWVTYWIGNRVIVSGDEQITRETVLQQIQQVFSLVQDAETGQRGFLLTGREEYLSPYVMAVKNIHAQLRRLDAAAGRGQVSRDAAQKIERLTGWKLDEMERTIDVARKEGRAAAIDIVQRDEGRRTMDALRDAVPPWRVRWTSFCAKEK
ncbi:MAG: CHASE3 domain-containing protein [Terrimicrobiaceae bacterium]|nr:CHASE3 domain-containing protein [Terrimicrobiaceae bacterium]